MELLNAVQKRKQARRSHDRQKRKHTNASMQLPPFSLSHTNGGMPPPASSYNTWPSLLFGLGGEQERAAEMTEREAGEQTTDRDRNIISSRRLYDPSFAPPLALTLTHSLTHSQMRRCGGGINVRLTILFRPLRRPLAPCGPRTGRRRSALD